MWEENRSYVLLVPWPKEFLNNRSLGHEANECRSNSLNFRVWKYNLSSYIDESKSGKNLSWPKTQCSECVLPFFFWNKEGIAVMKLQVVTMGFVAFSMTALAGQEAWCGAKGSVHPVTAGLAGQEAAASSELKRACAACSPALTVQGARGSDTSYLSWRLLCWDDHHPRNGTCVAARVNNAARDCCG